MVPSGFRICVSTVGVARENLHVTAKSSIDGICCLSAKMEIFALQPFARPFHFIAEKRLCSVSVVAFHFINYITFPVVVFSCSSDSCPLWTRLGNRSLSFLANLTSHLLSGFSSGDS